jgi:hypothetical protein
MENIINSRSDRVYSFIDKFEDVFITVASIVIGLSPLLILL